MSMSHKRIVYVAAGVLLRADGAILLTERPQGKAMAGLWELPGGKIERDETPEVALIREFKEELDVTLAETDLMPLTFASHSYSDFHLVMPVFEIKHWQGEPSPQEGQAMKWVAPQDLKALPAPAADIPLFDFIETWYGHENVH